MRFRKAVGRRKAQPALVSRRSEEGGTRPARSTRRRRLAAAGASAVCLAAASYALSPLAGSGSVAPESGADATVVLASNATKTGAVGVQFSVKVPGQIVAARLSSPGYATVGQVSLWKADGTILATSADRPTGVRGTRYVGLTSAVAVTPGEIYTVSYVRAGSHSARNWHQSAGIRTDDRKSNRNLLLGNAVAGDGSGMPTEIRAVRGVSITPVLKVSAVATPSPSPEQPTPTTSPTPAPPEPTPTSPSGGIPSSFPGASNTGVPPGTALSSYTGPCTVRSDLVIEAKQVNCDLVVYSGTLTIKSSKVNGIVINDYDTGSLNISDSEINGGQATRNVVGSRQVTILRSNIHGGKDSVQCNFKCTVRDSWLHGQFLAPGNTGHLQAFLSNGGQEMTLIHNTLSCDVKVNNVDGGCTAATSMFGDFEALRNFTFDGNLFVASTEMSYCAYAGYGEGKPYSKQVSGVVFTNNVFQRGSNSKCGLYGPVTGFKADLPGAVWKNNVWDDGKAVASAE